MDFHLKQWRHQHQHQHQLQEQSEPNHQQQSSASANAAKIPRLLLHSPSSATTTTLPLFVNQHQQQEQEQAEEAEAAAAAHPRNNSSSSGMGSYFSWAQWQELELQALIYRYMIAGAAVPPELLHPIKKSLLLHSSPYFLHSPQYPPSAALLHSGYWGRAAMDPEPGRCRRTDGKKWRCSRDVVAGQKYCERHMHRGRNRSRKPVEIPPTPTPTPTPNASAANTVTVAAAAGAVAGGGVSRFSLSGSSTSFSSVDLFHLNPNYTTEVKSEGRGGLFGGQGHAESRGDGHVLRHFFDDWPRPLQESDSAGGAADPSGCLSMSDVSLKLSTGNGDEPSRNPGRDQQQLPMSAWATGWGSNQVASMGGPLAEALRSSSTAARSSPTSVLHHMPRGSVSEASFVSN